MSRSSLVRTLSLLLASTALFACGTDTAGDDIVERSLTPALTWSQFKAKTFREPSTGAFIYDGDMVAENEEELREVWETTFKVAGDALILNRVGSADDRWDDDRKHSLTYCVSASFGTRHDQVVRDMAAAAGAWEQVADVKFVYRGAQDDRCNATNSDVLFDVVPTSYASYLARAFFPSSSRDAREVIIADEAFTTDRTTLAGILRHELGHTLGFRHEHTRPESGTCFENNEWRALTAYDAESVMHYPQCHGTGDWSLRLTAMDIEGAKSVYGRPGSTRTPAPPAPGTPSNPSSNTISKTFTGSLATGRKTDRGSFPVIPGTTFEATLSGEGNLDLYVRFNKRAGVTTSDCKSTGATSEERCELVVPAGAREAYVMVKAKTAGNYEVTATYEKR